MKVRPAIVLSCERCDALRVSMGIGGDVLGISPRNKDEVVLNPTLPADMLIMTYFHELYHWTGNVANMNRQPGFGVVEEAEARCFSIACLGKLGLPMPKLLTDEAYMFITMHGIYAQLSSLMDSCHRAREWLEANGIPIEVPPELSSAK